MPHITTCSKCGRAYEEQSEERANEPNRKCLDCYREHYQQIASAPRVRVRVKGPRIY